MSAVQPLAMYDQQHLASDEESKSGSDSGDESSGSSKAGYLAMCCCCCCCFLFFHLVGSIVAALASIGYTSCPAAPQLALNATLIPPRHMLVHDYYQGSSLSSSGMGRGPAGDLWTETNLFNPVLSNTTRLGYWRDSKTWYGRGQWAYVVEGTNEAAAVAWQPWLTLMRTYEVKWCFPPKQYHVSQEHIWFWNWGSNMQKWSISENGVMIAVSDARKEWDQGFLFGQAAPHGWHSVVTSASLPGTVIASTNQILDSWYADKETWQVNCNRTDLLDPFVVSFMSVEAIRESGGGGRSGKR